MLRFEKQQLSLPPDYWHQGLLQIASDDFFTAKSVTATSAYLRSRIWLMDFVNGS